MKLTRFAQSCLLIETKGKKILVDPGDIFFDESLLPEYWNNIDVLLVTHKHSDHCYVPAIQEIMKNPQTKFYSTAEVAEKRPELHPDIIKVWDIFQFDEITIKVVPAVHGFLPHLKWWNEIFESVGYTIDDGEKKLYIVWDSLCFSTEETCDILFVPVCNHWLVMWPFDAARFAQQVQAKLVIPCHYENLVYPIALSVVEEEFKKQNISYRILERKGSIEI